MATLSIQVRKEVEDKLREAASTSHREPEALVSALIERIVLNADLWLIVATHLDSGHFSFEHFVQA